MARPCARDEHVTIRLICSLSGRWSWSAYKFPQWLDGSSQTWKRRETALAKARAQYPDAREVVVGDGLWDGAPIERT